MAYTLKTLLNWEAVYIVMVYTLKTLWNWEAVVSAKHSQWGTRRYSTVGHNYILVAEVLRHSGQQPIKTKKKLPQDS